MSEQQAELVSKIKKLMTDRFGGTDAAARAKLFEAYDANHDGQIDRDEIKKLLADAGIGNGFTRGAWASGVIAKLDTDEDTTVSLEEFESVFG